MTLHDKGKKGRKQDGKHVLRHRRKEVVTGIVYSDSLRGVKHTKKTAEVLTVCCLCLLCFLKVWVMNLISLSDSLSIDGDVVSRCFFLSLHRGNNEDAVSSLFIFCVAQSITGDVLPCLFLLSVL